MLDTGIVDPDFPIPLLKHHDLPRSSPSDRLNTAPPAPSPPLPIPEDRIFKLSLPPAPLPSQPRPRSIPPSAESLAPPDSTNSDCPPLVARDPTRVRRVRAARQVARTRTLVPPGRGPAPWMLWTWAREASIPPIRSSAIILRGF